MKAFGQKHGLILALCLLLAIMAPCAAFLLRYGCSKAEAVEPTPVPVPVPTPVPTPAPTPAPTPEPLFELPQITADPGYYGAVLASGSFSSSYGLGIDLLIDYSVTALNADEVSVALTVSVQSGALSSGEVLLDLSAGGSFVTLTAAPVSYDGMSISKHSLGAQSFTVAAPAGQTTSIPVQAAWHFNGSYSGNSLPVLECGGSIGVVR